MSAGERIYHTDTSSAGCRSAFSAGEVLRGAIVAEGANIRPSTSRPWLICSLLREESSLRPAPVALPAAKVHPLCKQSSSHSSGPSELFLSAKGFQRKQQLLLDHSCQRPEIDLYRHSTEGIFVLNEA